MDGLLKSLMAIARRVAPRLSYEEREALAQDTLLRFASHNTEVIGNQSGYAHRIATNIVIDQYRRLRARGGAAIPLEEVYDTPALAYAADQESALLLKQVILALPPLYRDVFILNRFMGLTYAEIAAKYGLSVKAVEYRMSRALALCEEALRD